MSVLPTGIAAPTGGYEISRSVRLRSSASGYFNRTPASASDRKTWTWSAWVKIGNPAASSAPLFCEYTDANNYFIFGFNAGALFVQMRVGGANAFVHDTDAVYRDPSAWYHIVYVLDTTQATNTNRAKLYVNGSQVSLTAYTTNTQWPALNTDYNVNTANAHRVGYDQPNSVYFDGYMTEINFIDGQALTPSSFGETDTTTGVWKPKRYAGTYGTNGFYLNFSDNSNNTAATIGKDSSGNGNNWTPNNISVTSGVTYDSMLDVPTMYADGGNGRGNYAVMNPLQSGSYVTLSNGNLTVTGNTSANSALSLATQDANNQKIYFEVISNWSLGAITTGFPQSALIDAESNSINYGWAIRYDGSHYGITGEKQTVTAFSFTNTDVIGVAIDAVNGAIYVSKNGSWLNSGDPTSGASKTGAFYKWTPTSSRGIFPTANGYNGTVSNANFGQRPFAHTPPTGFKALNTQNLPDATIKKGNAYFDVLTWTGNGASRSITGLNFQPDFVWPKARNAAIGHLQFDSVRGATKYLQSASTAAEGTGSDSLTAFNADGFSLGADTSTTGVNQNGTTYVGWNWKESVSAGFDIVTYTFSTAGTNTVNHSLGVAPQMIIMKDRTASYNWDVYHASVGYTQRLILNSTTGATSGFWAAAPTSTQFSVTSSAYNNNDLIVAYCFAEVAGYSKFGSYVGNNSTDGPFVYLGFRPRFVMFKDSSANGVWMIMDSSRNTYNVFDDGLAPNNSNAESTYSGTPQVDFLSNGFKIRANNTGQYWNNISGNTYIYAAFAESPFRYSLAR